MSLSQNIARQIREVYHGDNWTAVSLHDAINNLSWETAVARYLHLNTIAGLMHHLDYYVQALIRTLRKEPLAASDKESFLHPPITSQSDWDELVKRVYANADELASLAEGLDDATIFAPFVKPQYGNNFRNLEGIVEHAHYHAGQMILLRKLLEAEA